MSYKRKHQLSKSPERHKHLRKYLKRFFWKRERISEKKDILDQKSDSHQKLE
jgi:hypothetical protein